MKAQKAIRKLNLVWGNYIVEENLHLTLKFLGYQSTEHIAHIKNHLQAINLSTFELRLKALGIFSNHVIWASVKGDGLDELVGQIEEALIEYTPKEAKPFAAHLTLLRLKKISRSRLFLESLSHIKLQELSFSVKDFVLIESKLSHEGAQYQTVARYYLSSN